MTRYAQRTIRGRRAFVIPYHPTCPETPIVAEEDKATQMFEAAPDFVAACAGQTFRDVSRLDWLSALITDYTERCPGPHEDPDAVFGMLAECRGLLADLRAAVLKAGGGQP